MKNNTSQNVCPTCSGEKVLRGQCECDSEWRGSTPESDGSDCHCTPDVECPTCHGTGSV